MQRIVLDTNCLLQIIPLQSPFRPIWDDIRIGEIHLCVSTEILNEYYEILSEQANISVAENIVNAITNNPCTEFFSPTFHFQIIKKDPDDNKFVDCAIVAQAQCIVSNDRHFAEVKACPFPTVAVLTLSQFADILNY